MTNVAYDNRTSRMEVHMSNCRIALKKPTRLALENTRGRAGRDGDLATVRRCSAILALGDGYGVRDTARVLGVSEDAVTSWVHLFWRRGVDGLKAKKSPGRPPKLTKTQRKELRQLIIDGPDKAGYPGACWRSPMIQDLVLRRFDVFYSARYISQLLGNMGFSYQKAKFVADGKNPEKRKEWLGKTWPEIMRVAKEKNAMVLFGDEASFPQWGSLTYTWSLRGEQPVVETSGTRRGYKVFGLIDYYTGRFFCKGHDQGRLNSESYEAFIKGVLSQTRKHIVLIQDGARYHTSRAMRDFFEMRSHRLTVYQLPSYSPDYNPIEKLWKKIKEKEVHLHHFPTFESLKTKVQAALVRFQDMQGDILRLFGFYTKMEASA